MRVLVAVKPVGLSQVVKHLLAPAPEIQVITSPNAALSLEHQVQRLQPDLVITNARHLGEQAPDVLADAKRLSPRSKIILTDFDARLSGLAHISDVDAYLEEESLVKRLLSATRRLAAQGRSTRKPKTSGLVLSPSRSRIRPRLKSQSIKRLTPDNPGLGETKLPARSQREGRHS